LIELPPAEPLGPGQHSLDAVNSGWLQDTPKKRRDPLKLARY
jgi:hypothetical protein